MGSIPRVKVINQKEDFTKTEYYINNQKIKRVRSVDFHVGENEVPTFDFEVSGIPYMDILADVRFSFTPETVDEAAVVLRNELLKHGDLYNAFKESIQSILKPNERYIGDGEFAIFAEYGSPYLAEDILKRIIGEE